MSDIADLLISQYGLKQTPSPEQVMQWATVAETLMNSGIDRETAGRDAAKKVFSELLPG